MRYISLQTYKLKDLKIFALDIPVFNSVLNLSWQL